MIAILCNRTVKQRVEIGRIFKTMYGKDLTKEVHGELSGNLRRVIKALLRSNEERDAYWLRKSMEGAGTDEAALIELLVTRTAEEIKAMKTKYQEMFSRDAEADIKSETRGHFGRLMVALAAANRTPESYVLIALLPAVPYFSFSPLDPRIPLARTSGSRRIWKRPAPTPAGCTRRARRRLAPTRVHSTVSCA